MVNHNTTIIIVCMYGRHLLLLIATRACTSIYSSTLGCYTLIVYNCCILCTPCNHSYFLLYIESPLSSNPILEQPNATSLHLMWSPPFLWPGYLIKSYNITVWSNSDDNINSYQVNSTSFSNAVVIFPFSPQHQHCTNFTFGITPMHHQLVNQTYYVIGGYLSGEYLC